MSNARPVQPPRHHRVRGNMRHIRLPFDLDARVLEYARQNDLSYAGAVVQVLRFAEPLFGPLLAICDAAKAGDVYALKQAIADLSYEQERMLDCRQKIAAQLVTLPPPASRRKGVPA